MEKRRRARINQSLNELKNLILEAMKKDVSKFETCHKANSELTQASCKKKQTITYEASAALKVSHSFCLRGVRLFLVITSFTE